MSMPSDPVPDSASPSAPRRVWNRYTSTFIDVPAGPDWRDRLRAALGAIGGIALTGILCAFLVGTGGLTNPLLIAPMGASAVLVFAVPASPLAQPWSVVGGNMMSALVGCTAAAIIPDRTASAAVAVGVAIVMMSLIRCLHPPGGAVAVAASLGGPASAAAHFGFAFVPVGLNSLILVLIGWLFHRFTGHSYPHRAPVAAPAHATGDAAPLDRVGVAPDDVDEVLAAYGEALDVDVADLRALLKDAEIRASARDHGDRVCADIMSRDIVSVEGAGDVADARSLLHARGLLSVPVLDRGGRVAGVATALGLAVAEGTVDAVAIDALLVGPDTPVSALVRPLSEGRRHEALVVDEDRRLIGMVTQTDLIAALAVPRAD